MELRTIIALGLLFAPLPAMAGGPVHTLTAQNHLAGVAESGQEGLVLALTTLPTGERFARLQLNGSSQAFWVQLIPGENPKLGERFLLPRSVNLFTAPVAEVEEESSEELPSEPVPYGGRSQYPMDQTRLGMASLCSSFIDASGNFGAWGTYLMGRLNPASHPNLFRTNVGDMPQICPRFSRMSVEAKKNFWVWLIASMANNESSCRERITARGVNGTAAGLLQLHKGQEHRYGCKAGMNSLRALENLECGLTILDNDIDRTERVFPRANNYWEVLRLQTRAGQRTLRLAKAYAPCF